MKKGTRIFLITLCSILIALSAIVMVFAGVNYFGNKNKAHADSLENEQEQFYNFNQLIDIRTVASTDTVLVNANTLYFNQWHSGTQANFVDITLIANHKYYLSCSAGDMFNLNNNNSLRFNNIVSVSSDTVVDYIYRLSWYNPIPLNTDIYFNIYDLTLMYGFGFEPTIEECSEIFTAPYYNYTAGTTISKTGFDAYNSGANNMRESMTIQVTSADIASNLDNVVINDQYSSDSKNLIQGYMVWGSSSAPNCTALINLNTNFNKNDYFEFEFYTITGADSLNLPNISTFYDLKIICLDSNGSIVELATIKAQNNATTPTKATFYLPFDTDKLYITTPHTYIVGYNNFIVNITTTNLTALSLYSYNAGYKAGHINGYTDGYNIGVSQENATIGTMGYIGAAFAGIGEILAIELLPGIPFGIFVTLPLMFGLIAFVVKLSKGGSS